MAASDMIAATASLPASPFRRASKADASRTASLTSGFCSALPDQFIREPTILGDEAPHEGLRFLNGGSARQHPDLAVTKQENHFISCLHAERTAVVGGDYQPTILADSCLDSCHVTAHSKSTTKLMICQA